jgi:iron complex outermembrane recepter protein
MVICTFAYAQNENPDSVRAEYKYPLEIVISAPRSQIPLKENSFATSIVGLDYLNCIPRSIAVDEALKLVPGVKIDNQANGERIHMSIRGQGILTERGIRGIKVSLDGIPINDPTGFAPDLFDVDWATTERVEVLRGPSASLFGGSSSAGIVNILTQDGVQKPLGGQGFFTAGSYNFWKALGQFGATVDKMNYRVSFSRSMGDGYRDHTHFWSDIVYGKATYTPISKVKLTPVMYYNDTYHENPEGINLQQYNENPKQANPDAVPFNEHLETQRFTAGLVGTAAINDMHDFSFNVYAKRTLFTDANNRTFIDRTYVTPGTSLQYNLHFGNKKVKNHISTGADFSWQDYDEIRMPNDHSVRVNTKVSDESVSQAGIGVFLIDRLEIGKFNLTASVRYDDIKNELTDNLKVNNIDQSGNANFNRTTGRFGVTYSPLDNVNIYANIGQGFLPPSSEELAQNPDDFGGFNQHLVPATSLGEEVGVRGTLTNKFYYDLSFFYLKTENDFDRYRLNNDPLRSQETFYMNAASSKRIGIETYLRYQPVNPLTIQAAYTFSDFKYTDGTNYRVVMDDTSIYKYVVDDNYLPNSPMHQLYIDVQYEFLPHFFVALSSETLSKAYIDGANVEPEAVEGYSLLHGRLVYEWRLKNFFGQISFNATNIGDSKYVAFSEPDPGGNAYQPGAGRQFFGNIKVNF